MVRVFVPFIAISLICLGCLGEDFDIDDAGESNADLAALYHFNESQGATSFLDSAFGGNDLSCLSGNCPDAGTQGFFDSGATFVAGNSDALTATDNSNLDNTQTLTIQLWIYPTNVGGTPRAIISKRVNVNTGLAYSIFTQTDNGLHSYLQGNTTKNWSATISNNRWYHISYVFDGTQAVAGNRLRMYLNGTEDGSSPQSEADTSLLDNASDLYLGTFNAADGRYLSAIYDEVAIYRIVLSPSRIFNDYRKGRWRHAFEGPFCNGKRCLNDLRWGNVFQPEIARMRKTLAYHGP